MKALGMVFIVWGHCFPGCGMSGFIYAFNVPLFFIVSGYLTRREQSFGIFWNKCLYNLIIPYFILVLINLLGYIIKHLDDCIWMKSIFGVVLGFNSFDGIRSCGTLWFVYTLIIIKIVFQLFIHDRRSMTLVCVLALCGVLAYNHFNIKLAWAVTNAMLAMPFFCLGNLCSSMCKAEFDSLFQKLRYSNLMLRILLVAILVVTTYFIGQYNGNPAMFMGLYGNNPILFAVGALVGCFSVLAISTILDDIRISFITTISTGSVVILAYHNRFLHPTITSIPDIGGVILTFILSVVVTLVFVPIIMILKRFFPIVLGRRAKNFKL